jgi:hypothetical protein
MLPKKSPIALCLGLPGSASTWAYNICAQLLMLKDASLDCLYADRFEDVRIYVTAAEAASTPLIIKSHMADRDLRAYFSRPNLSVILTVRDPRDCVLSLMERFHLTFDFAVAGVLESCKTVLDFQRFGIPLLRYEDQFFDSKETVIAMHRYLQIEVDCDFDELLRQHRKEAVISFIETFDELPKERIQILSAIDSCDKATQWHTRHFGDGLVGKWQQRFSYEQKTILDRELGPAIEALGYAATVESDICEEIEALV